MRIWPVFTETVTYVRMAIAYNPQSVDPICLATFIVFILIFVDLVNNKRPIIISVLSLIDGYSES